ncbi:MAG: ParA family protein [Gammaproteobacteria bacterium]|nr:MAG: ParA family protein [Gammaproteobacteria bacterium]
MKLWAVANQKGGVGKTTTAVILAGLLAERGARVVLVDLDPHASASGWLLSGSPRREGVGALFAGADGAPPIESLLEPTSQPGLQMLRATPALAAVERRLATQSGMGCVLANALGALRAETDYVLLDCPPTLGLLLVNALAAAERVIVPVQTEPLALEGLRRMRETLAMIGRSQGRVIDHWTVPTLYDQRTRASRDVLELLHADFPEGLWPGVIPVDTRLRDASLAGELPSSFCPRSRAVGVYRMLLAALLGERPRDAAVTWDDAPETLPLDEEVAA